MEEDQLSREESLKLVTTMISQAKNTFYENGLGLLLWGFTNLLCFTLAYLAATQSNVRLPFSPFFLMILTMVVHIYFARRERKFRKVKTVLDDAILYAWMAFGICVVILTLGGAYANIGYTVLPLLLLFFGMPTFITGCLTRFSPLIWGGIICWIFAIACFVYKSYYAYLLVAGGVTAAWIIPGFMLRAKFMKNLHV